MNTLKFDRVRKQVKVEGFKKPIKAVELDYFVQQNTFDKAKSDFFNHKGLTYITYNEPSEMDQEIFVPVKLQYQDAPELSRLLAGKSQKEINEINELKKEYGY